MDKSQRNILIIIGVVVIIGCIFITLVGIGAVAYFLPLNRMVTIDTTNEAVISVEEIPTTTAGLPEDTPNPTEPFPSPESTEQELATDPVPAATASKTPVPIPGEIANQMDIIDSQVIELRNLQPNGFVTRNLITRDQLREKLESDFYEDYPPEEIEVDQLVFSVLGLLDRDFDISTFYQDLLGEQIAGQYDQKTKQMDVVQDVGFGGIERLTYAHEYTHALQDQNFDIENGLNYNSESCEQDSERCAAVQALLEGDAYLTEFEWVSNYASPQDWVDIQDWITEYESPVFDSAPAFLREDFTFPVNYGQIFVEYIYNRGGWEAVNDVYRNLPVSTEQILHPERYPEDQPVLIEIPDVSSLIGESWEEVDRGVMGEWSTYQILAHGADPEAQLSESESKSASDGWGGDQYIVYYDKQNGAIVFVLHTSWESVNDATQFYNAFQKHSTARFGAPSILQTDRVGWEHDAGYTELSTQDQFTTWVIAQNEQSAQQISSLIYNP
ncbi:MAG: hypothetical protein JSV42_06175 [Chloroflexota bacterium]|nr:MAG: hypothetical protein JSV42_06175 [Chloroflexota bacterium]